MLSFSRVLFGGILDAMAVVTDFMMRYDKFLMESGIKVDVIMLIWCLI